MKAWKMLTSSEFWKACLVRAIKTMAETAIATIGSSALLSEVHWGVVISSTILAGILSILLSLGGLPEVGNSGQQS